MRCPVSFNNAGSTGVGVTNEWAIREGVAVLMIVEMIGASEPVSASAEPASPLSLREAEDMIFESLVILG